VTSYDFTNNWLFYQNRIQESGVRIQLGILYEKAYSAGGKRVRDSVALAYSYGEASYAQRLVERNERRVKIAEF